MPVEMKRMIAEQFAKLLEQKRMEKITVKELVSACGISRQTFYYHFQDTMEVVEYLVEQHLEQSLERGRDADSPQEVLKLVMSATEKDVALLKHLLASQRREEILAILVHASRSYIAQMLRAKVKDMAVTVSDLELAVNFYAYGFVGMMLADLGKELDLDVRADQIVRLISGRIFQEAEKDHRDEKNG